MFQYSTFSIFGNFLSIWFASFLQILICSVILTNMHSFMPFARMRFAKYMTHYISFEYANFPVCIDRQIISNFEGFFRVLIYLQKILKISNKLYEIFLWKWILKYWYHLLSEKCIFISHSTKIWTTEHIKTDPMPFFSIKIFLIWAKITSSEILVQLFFQIALL